MKVAYIARVGEAGPVKIGESTHPKHRIAAIQAQHYQDITIIRTFRGGTTERWLHRHYAHLRLRGEWFQFCPTMLTIRHVPKVAKATGLTQAQLLGISA